MTSGISSSVQVCVGHMSSKRKGDPMHPVTHCILGVIQMIPHSTDLLLLPHSGIYLSKQIFPAAPTAPVLFPYSPIPWRPLPAALLMRTL